ncbi:bifunctional phosphoribosylaminoimidazolecarboxamide formyltransferase/IMP cyclohydrolase [candidate division KSB1 bacterium]|nr:bifunctional phosphoribosylaminoimidazolecarboxamide formyltransferase/IMP cyclohydrolase [candidate division KSB1 bacterium]
MTKQSSIKRALISVYDKSDILDLARLLAANNVEILSTGGTAKFLMDNGVSVQPVSDITGFPEILGGRVKTLHPRIHGGILAKRDKPEQMQELDSHQITPIDLVVINLYPFEKTIANPDCNLDTALENIDIGGPCMIRAAAKNFPAVVVLTDPKQYPEFIGEFKQNKGEISAETRKKFARSAFLRTSRYDHTIQSYLKAESETEEELFPQHITLNLEKIQDLRYGENPHQKAALYNDMSTAVSGKQLHGKALSFNNILDMYSAIGLVNEFDSPCAIVVKHNTPCGAALDDKIESAFERAFATDSLSAFGGVVALNRPLTLALAEKLSKIFLEVIIAPSFEENALSVLTRKKNIRLIQWSGETLPQEAFDIKRSHQGLLLQTLDRIEENLAGFNCVTETKPSENDRQTILFGWQVGKWVKSNAIVYVKDRRTLGIGAGQMSRVDASRLAVRKAADAKLDLHGSILISDAFFPFRDGVDVAAEAGAIGVIQPGGSIRDQEVIDAANEHKMFMLFSGVRHFRH